MRQRRIQYAIDQDTGLVWSRVGDEVAVPMLDYEGMSPDNEYKTNYFLERCKAWVTVPYAILKWTRKVHIDTKNIHRKFWGMKELV